MAISSPVGVYDHPARAAYELLVWSRRIWRVSFHALPRLRLALGLWPLGALSHVSRRMGCHVVW